MLWPAAFPDIRGTVLHHALQVAPKDNIVRVGQLLFGARRAPAPAPPGQIVPPRTSASIVAGSSAAQATPQQPAPARPSASTTCAQPATNAQQRAPPSTSSVHPMSAPAAAALGKPGRTVPSMAQGTHTPGSAAPLPSLSLAVHKHTQPQDMPGARQPFPPKSSAVGAGRAMQFRQKKNKAKNVLERMQGMCGEGNARFFAGCDIFSLVAVCPAYVFTSCRMRHNLPVSCIGAEPPHESRLTSACYVINGSHVLIEGVVSNRCWRVGRSSVRAVQMPVGAVSHKSVDPQGSGGAGLVRGVPARLRQALQHGTLHFLLLCRIL